MESAFYKTYSQKLWFYWHFTSVFYAPMPGLFDNFADRP